ncbi:MAG: DMT family transporter [candidate division NC10 bacterium]|nr:DMT family transporter [candidate division NC10 bacterium]
MDRAELKTISLTVLLCMVWGSTFPPIKILMNALPPFTVAGSRFLLASLFLLPIIYWRGLEFPRHREEIFSILGFGLLQTTLMYAIFFWGVQYTSAGRAAILLNTHPFLVATLAHFYLPDDRISWTKVLGLVLGLAGMVFVAWDRLKGGVEGSLIGDLAMVASAACWAVSTVLGKKISEKVDVLILTTGQMLSGSFLLLALGFLLERDRPFQVSVVVIVSFAYLVLLSTSFAFFLWFYLLEKNAASKLSAFLFLIPIFGVLSSHLVLGERITVNLVWGVLLVGAGIVLVNRAGGGAILNRAVPPE